MAVTSAFQSWFRERESSFSGQLLFDEPLSKHTYYRIGGPAAVLAVPKSLDDLRLIADGIARTGARLVILGLGSNILVDDDGLTALVVKTSRLNLDISAPSADASGASSDGSTLIRTGGSVAISTLLRRAVQDGWGGLEFLTGIPGSVGGVVRMNAGTHLGEAKDALVRIEAFPLLEVASDSGLQAFHRDVFRFEYRRNLFLPPGMVVWSADWKVRLDSPSKVKASIDETLLRRKSTQPIDYPSCGSVFKNPCESGMSAWQVVDKLGLRGHRVGGAQFAEKHSNFIINLGDARSVDVKALIELAKTRALAELGIRLEEEVIYLHD